MSCLLRSVLVCSALATPLLAQQQSGAVQPAARDPKHPVTHADYARWETLGAGALSPDGKWVAYDFRRGNGPGDLRYRAVGSDSERSIQHGTAPTFTNNSRWLLYTIVPDTSSGRGGGRGGRGGGRGAGAAANDTPVRNKTGIVDLKTGANTVLDDVQSYALSNDGVHVALRRYAPTGRTSAGADLVVRDLDQGTDLTFGNVAEYVWSDDGALLAMTVDVEGKTGDGVQVLNAATGTLRSLDAADALYSGIQWRWHGDDLAAFKSRVDSGFADTSYTVLVWRGLTMPKVTKQSYDFSTDAAFPKGMRVASYRTPVWADDGSTVFFGIAPREPKPAPWQADALQPARVEVWHWKDLREYHQQDRQAAQDRRKTQLVAWNLGQNHVVRLADDSMDNVLLSRNGKAALTSDDAPYFKETISGRPYRDVYRVDIGSGKREKLAAKVVFLPAMSPDGRVALYAQNGAWWAVDMGNGSRTNITAKTGATFVDTEDDHPAHERRPYGLGGFLAGGKAVLLYDRFDVWQVGLDGASFLRLTRGREDSTVYRLVTLDREERWIDPTKPLVYTATGEFTRKSGVARMLPGQPVQRVLWLDKDVARLAKAKDADVFLFAEQTYQESPNYFVSGPTFADAKPVSRTNAFQGDYLWGKQELLSYTNKAGDKLQMMLTYPADYQPGKKYPMVVYYYEKLSQGFHQYVVPSDRATYNTQVFSQEGYFVLRPDIRFKARDAGMSGLDCVTSAVNAVLATGMVDPKRVGNMGHSWGGYQSAFYAVHGHGMFAATIAGAPLTDFISMYGYTSFNTGAAETGHFETGQERMDVSLWEDPQAYIRNSTVFAVDSLETPLLLEEGDADGNVNYWQSMELYNFGRRLGKQVVFLIYNDENHGVARPESQMDYHRRQLEWFAHYLKGEAAAEWITKGETYLARQRLLNAAKSGADTGSRGQAKP